MTIDQVLSDALADPVPFRPWVDYDEDTGCVEIIVTPESFVAKQVDERVTMYVGRESGVAVGALMSVARRSEAGS